MHKDRLCVTSVLKSLTKWMGFFVQEFSQVQLNVSWSIKLFPGLLSFVDMNSKTTHTDALFGYSNSVVRPHFISNRSLDVDCTLSNHLALVLNCVYCKTEMHFTVTQS